MNNNKKHLSLCFPAPFLFYALFDGVFYSVYLKPSYLLFFSDVFPFRMDMPFSDFLKLLAHGDFVLFSADGDIFCGN